MQCLLDAFPFDETHTVRVYFWATVFGTWLLTFVKQQGKRNFSIVDRLWTVYPLSLVLLWPIVGARAQVATGLVALWSFRLTYHSWRRGYYALDAEDYRWAHVRRWFASSIAWELFNFFFISLAQTTLLYLIARPVRRIPLASSSEWSLAELGLVCVMLVLLALEAVADQQQYRFHAAKKKESGVGFVHTGLWRYSRHPNVFCELMFWTTLSGYCAVVSRPEPSLAGLWEYLVGPVCLALLLQQSTALTESISRAKYPTYRAYQIGTSKLVPWVPWTNAKIVSTAHKC
ncbi:hypothetical protein GGI25_005509 [Coemansia spiralis]|uniref:Steroid 5-alpha reductase C-terminal domain-containing protein n=2 Tax=Coemansia TaxID=4863 RepID=A0A9W8G3R8_9FUNG|nr:hypothetical protein EDC05_005561 [Coemansia umbellata]KAJ2619527.1 hypothetical protein GGI26_005765 [Coemansia sp. RSA 1358]KAJ2671391.1 hypothetical protein GGI25_005509 [Coemansia spiralis]